ncbi:MAG TPA: hypothetical protein PLL06_22530, partial [Acidobacteriota bacterium]|nr:hypothetical protein [Acidobacteriota bacterium]
YQNDKKLRALPNLLWEEFHIAPNQFELVHVGGEFPDPHLTKLLKDGVRGKRLPQNYVKVSLDNLTIKSLAEPVMQSLISFATKEFSPFSAQQLASDTYGVFDKLAFETRLVFIRHVKEVMNQFLKNHGKELVRRSVPDPPTWEFTWDGIDFGRMHVGKKLQRAADNFLKSINHGLFQASLFDE